MEKADDSDERKTGGFESPPSPMESNVAIERFENMRAECTCGHVGNSPNSDHKDTFQPGHGRCTKCDCPKFRWKKYLKDPDYTE